MWKLGPILLAASIAAAAFTAQGQRLQIENNIGSQIMVIEWVAPDGQSFRTEGGQVVRLTGRSKLEDFGKMLPAHAARRTLMPGMAFQVVAGRRAADNAIVAEQLATVAQ